MWFHIPKITVYSRIILCILFQQTWDHSCKATHSQKICCSNKNCNFKQLLSKNSCCIEKVTTSHLCLNKTERIRYPCGQKRTSWRQKKKKKNFNFWISRDWNYTFKENSWTPHPVVNNLKTHPTTARCTLSLLLSTAVHFCDPDTVLSSSKDNWRCVPVYSCHGSSDSCWEGCTEVT